MVVVAATAFEPSDESILTFPFRFPMRAGLGLAWGLFSERPGCHFTCVVSDSGLLGN